MVLKMVSRRMGAVGLGLTLACVAGALAASEVEPAAKAVPVLRAGQKVQVQQPAQRVALDVPSGHVVQLRFMGAGAHLDVRDAQGRHVRRLATDGRGVQTALWQPQAAQQEQLWIVPTEKNLAAPPAQLELLRTWPTQGYEQPAPDDTPMAPLLKKLEHALAQGQDTTEFWHHVQQHGTPWVEPWGNGQWLVTFLWRGRNQHNVRLFGSPSGEHNPLRQLAGSDVWWTSAVMDPRTRLSYALAPDVPRVTDAAQQRRMILTTMQRDSLNPHTFPASLSTQAVDRFQGRSVLELPQAPAQSWVAARAGVPQGQLTRHTLHSHVLGNARDVWTYVPAGGAPQALLVLFDAHAFVHDVPTPRILDNLMADGLLPRTAAVIVGNASPEARSTELPPNPLFAQFMAQELMPWVNAQGLAQPAQRTVVAGSSYGGLVSSYLGLMHPQLFGKVLSMSGSYWWAPAGEPAGWMQRAWQALPEPVPAVQFYIDAGLFETGRGGRAGIVETSRELADVLRARGLHVTQREFMSGHDYAQWQGSLGCGLVALLAPQQLADARMQVCAGVQK